MLSWVTDWIVLWCSYLCSNPGRTFSCICHISRGEKWKFLRVHRQHSHSFHNSNLLVTLGILLPNLRFQCILVLQFLFLITCWRLVCRFWSANILPPFIPIESSRTRIDMDNRGMWIGFTSIFVKDNYRGKLLRSVFPFHLLSEFQKAVHVKCRGCRGCFVAWIFQSHRASTLAQE